MYIYKYADIYIYMCIYVHKYAYTKHVLVDVGININS
jgi:hypothetical protein